MGKTFSELLAAKRRVKELEQEVVILKEQLRPIPPPNIVGEISAAEVEAKIREIFPNVETFKIADRKYKLTTVEEMNRFLARDDTDKITWVREWPDCDDFTRRLLGNMTVPGWWSLAKGDCWIYGEDWGHSIVITLLYEGEQDTEPRVYFIEGQSDAMELAPEMFEDISVGLIKI